MSLALIPLLPWVSGDGKVIILARGLRAFSHGFLAILLGLYLIEAGFSLVRVGVLLSAGVAGAAFFAFLVGLISEWVGRGRLLTALSLLSAGAGLALFFVDDFLPLLAVVFLGSLGSGAVGAVGPLHPLEQAILSDASAPHRRTDLFAINGMISVAASALGALAAGLPTFYQDALGMSTVSAYKAMFLGFASLQAVGALLYLLLSPAAEGGAAERRWVNPLRLPSRRIIFTLTGLFGFDHFAGSLMMQSLIAYWFSSRFGIHLGSLALLFFFSHLLSAASLWLAAKIANRVGLINTMVFSQIPAGLLVIAVALAPTAWLVVLFWQLRSFLGSMDQPTRDSYTMAVVGPDERVAMASMNVVGRSMSGTVGPSVGAILWNSISASTPLIASGMVKIAYALSLYFMFRNVRPPEEAVEAESLPVAPEAT